jgi:hypothetical protein
MKNLLPTTMPAIYPRKLIHTTQLLRRPTSRTLLNMTPTKLRGTCKRVQLTTPQQPHTEVQYITPPQLLPTTPLNMPVQSSSLRIMKRNIQTTTLPPTQSASQPITPQPRLLGTTLPRFLTTTANRLLDTTTRILPTPAANQLRATVTSLGSLFLPIAHTHHIRWIIKWRQLITDMFTSVELWVKQKHVV